MSGEQKFLVPSSISALSEHTPSFCYYPGFYDVGLFSERHRERLKEGEMEERDGEEEKFLKGVRALGFQVPLSKELGEESVGIGLSSGCSER